MENLPSAKQRARIFISYKRNIEPDEPVATAVCEALSKHYDVFIDKTMLVGAPWAKRIDEEIAGPTSRSLSFRNRPSIARWFWRKLKRRTGWEKRVMARQKFFLCVLLTMRLFNTR